MEFSRQQDAALRAVGDWLEDKSAQPVFRLFGYAGTGKTTLARHFAQGVDGRVAFCAFTGKAAYVLRQKGCDEATTIHSLIYQPKDKSGARLRDLLEQRAKFPPGPADNLPKEARELDRKIKEERLNLARPAFSLNLDSAIRECKLVVVDECSMVDEYMANDLMSFGVKILVLGDPAQLPPVRGTGFFTDADPDFMLTDIHRQAKDSPIIQLATQIRQRQLPDYGSYGQSRVRRDINAELVMEADQVLVGRNETRRKFNQRTRQLLGRQTLEPIVGDRLVCLQNDHDIGLLNGEIWTVDMVGDRDSDRVTMQLKSEDESRSVAVEAHLHHFQGRELPYWEKRDAQEFDYGYALTCHKSQGSQWNHVVVYDESAAFRQDRWRWLYTAVTRAAVRVDIVAQGG